jgi:hypothetical protein
VRDVCHGNVVASRTMVMQEKTQRPVQVEITEQTRDAVAAWIRSSQQTFIGIRRYSLRCFHELWRGAGVSFGSDTDD